MAGFDNFLKINSECYSLSIDGQPFSCDQWEDFFPGETKQSQVYSNGNVQMSSAPLDKYSVDSDLKGINLYSDLAKKLDEWEGNMQFLTFEFILNMGSRVIGSDNAAKKITITGIVSKTSHPSGFITRKDGSPAMLMDAVITGNIKREF